MNDWMGVPHALVQHELPGRLRIRIPSRRGDAAFLEGVGVRLAAMPGLRSLRVNPLTGGLLIEHSASTGAITAFAREHGLFDVSAPVTAPATLSAVQAVPAALPAPLSVAAAGLAAAGVYQLTRGRMLGSGSESLWNAYSAYAVLRKPWLAVVLAGCGVYQVAAGQGLGSAVSLFLYALSARRLAQGQASEAAT